MIDKINKIFIRFKLLTKTQKILLAGLLICLFAFVPRDAQAAIPVAVGWAVGAVATYFFGKSLVGSVVEKFAMAIAKFFGWIIQVEGKILSWVLDVSNFTSLPIVQTGWKICRDFANLFFIAILIYIAFAIILRLQKGDAKKLLFKVITIAIIINFSLMIGGIIIDFSQVLFRYFIFSPLQNKNGVAFSEEVANAFRLQTFFSPAESEAITEGDLDSLEGVGDVFTRLLFIIIFLGLVIIVFGAITFTLVVRNFWLWILLILSPLAWFLGIVPVPILSKYSSEWWRNFLKWCFMAPIMGFFIFLSLQIVKEQGPDKPQTADTITTINSVRLQEAWNNSEGKGGSEEIFSFKNDKKSIFNPSNVIGMLVTCAFLIGGLMAGQSLGSGAAKGALGMINTAKKNTQKWMGRRAMQTAPVRMVNEKILAPLSNIPVLGRLVKRPAWALQKSVGGARGEDVKAAQERIKSLSDDQLKKSWINLNEYEKQAAAKKLGNDKLDDKMFEAMQKIYGKIGANGAIEARLGFEKEFKDLQKSHPYWTGEFKKNSKELSENQSVMDRSEAIYKSAQEEYEKNKSDYDKFKAVYDTQVASGASSASAEATLKTMEVNMLASQNKVDAAKKGFDNTRETIKPKIDNVKAAIAGQFKEFDWKKASDGFLNSIAGDGDVDPAVVEATITLMSDKPFKDGLGKVLSKINKKGDWARTAEMRQKVAVKTMSKIVLVDDEKLGMTIKTLSNFDGSPAARSGKYDSNGVLEKLREEKIINDVQKEIIKKGLRKKAKEKSIVDAIKGEIEIPETGSEKNKEKDDEENKEAKKEEKK